MKQKKIGGWTDLTAVYLQPKTFKMVKSLNDKVLHSIKLLTQQKKTVKKEGVRTRTTEKVNATDTISEITESQQTSKAPGDPISFEPEAITQ